MHSMTHSMALESCLVYMPLTPPLEWAAINTIFCPPIEWSSVTARASLRNSTELMNRKGHSLFITGWPVFTMYEIHNRNYGKACDFVMVRFKGHAPPLNLKAGILVGSTLPLHGSHNNVSVPWQASSWFHLSIGSWASLILTSRMVMKVDFSPFWDRQLAMHVLNAFIVVPGCCNRLI